MQAMLEEQLIAKLKVSLMHKLKLDKKVENEGNLSEDDFILDHY
jgi:hypothetical protein